MKEIIKGVTIKKRPGRPRKETNEQEMEVFDPLTIKFVRGTELKFSDELFKPMKTKTEIDVILSTEGGLMPGTNIVVVGGPGSGKTTITLDWMSKWTKQGYKALFISAEMDEIAFYKYCKRMPQFANVQTLFLKNHSNNVKEAVEYAVNLGYDVICMDSLAEVIGMYRDQLDASAKQAERWLLELQDRMKKGENEKGYYTSFVNIQQVTKSDEFVGSNRLKHMTDAMALIERSRDGLERTIHFCKNRDCDKDFKMNFSFYDNKVHYSYEQMSED